MGDSQLRQITGAQQWKQRSRSRGVPALNTGDRQAAKEGKSCQAGKPGNLLAGNAGKRQVLQPRQPLDERWQQACAEAPSQHFQRRQPG